MLSLNSHWNGSNTHTHVLTPQHRSKQKFANSPIRREKIRMRTIFEFKAQIWNHCINNFQIFSWETWIQWHNSHQTMAAQQDNIHLPYTHYTPDITQRTTEHRWFTLVHTIFNKNPVKLAITCQQIRFFFFFLLLLFYVSFELKFDDSPLITPLSTLSFVPFLLISKCDTCANA